MKPEIGYIIKSEYRKDGKSIVNLINKDVFNEEDKQSLPEIDDNGVYNSSVIKFNKDDNGETLSITLYGFDFQKEKEKIKGTYEKWKSLIAQELTYHSQPHLVLRRAHELIEAIDALVEKVDPEDISHVNNIYCLFKDSKDCPLNANLLNGVPMDTIYSYVSTAYLNGFINYVDVFHAIMIRRYQPLERDDNNKGWAAACATVIEKVNQPHTNISESCEIDDVLILAESDDSYWFFWDDCDGSDSCIGRLDKRYYRKEDLIDLLHRSVPMMIGSCNKEYIVLPKFSGWVTL